MDKMRRWLRRLPSLNCTSDLDACGGATGRFLVVQACVNRLRL